MTDFGNVTNIVESATVEPAPAFGAATSGTLSDTTSQVDITTSENGACAWTSFNLKNMQNGDDFDFYLYRYSGTAWLTYVHFNITMVAGAISIDTGAGAVVTNIGQIDYENIYLDSTHSLRITRVRNSAIDRNFLYRYNLLE